MAKNLRTSGGKPFLLIVDILIWRIKIKIKERSFVASLTDFLEKLWRITLRESMTNGGLRNEVCITMVQTSYGFIA